MPNYEKVSPIMCESVPRETILNKLTELRKTLLECNELSGNIHGKLYNPEPCPISGMCNGAASEPTIESLIDEIRQISRDANYTLNDINNRL